MVPVCSRNQPITLDWRLHTRGMFDEAFAKGYLATDMLMEAGRGYYLLKVKGDH